MFSVPRAETCSFTYRVLLLLNNNVWFSPGKGKNNKLFPCESWKNNENNHGWKCDFRCFSFPEFRFVISVLIAIEKKNSKKNDHSAWFGIINHFHNGGLHKSTWCDIDKLINGQMWETNKLSWKKMGNPVYGNELVSDYGSSSLSSNNDYYWMQQVLVIALFLTTDSSHVFPIN